MKPEIPVCAECGRQLPTTASRMTYRGQWICRSPRLCVVQVVAAAEEWVQAAAAVFESGLVRFS